MLIKRHHLSKGLQEVRSEPSQNWKENPEERRVSSETLKWEHAWWVQQTRKKIRDNQLGKKIQRLGKAIGTEARIQASRSHRLGLLRLWLLLCENDEPLEGSTQMS